MKGDIRAEYEENGVVVIEKFLSEEEADELRKAGEEFENEKDKEPTSVFSAKETEKAQNRDKYFIESNDKIRYFLEAEEGSDKKTVLNKVGHALHWLHPLFRFYTFSSRVKQTCQALGMTDPAVVQSMLIYKAAKVGGEVCPHQDATYLSTDPETAVGFWIALDDATLENGCMWFSKGSHKSGVHRRLSRNPDTTSNEFLIYDRPQPLYQSSNFTPCPVKKGDCILIHGQVVHQSGPNKSSKSRPAYTFHTVERGAKYSPGNWLQEGPGAPFVSLYTASQEM